MDLKFVEWREFVPDSVILVVCDKCQAVAPESPKGWMYCYIGVKGKGRHGEKVKSVRHCPACHQEWLASMKDLE